MDRTSYQHLDAILVEDLKLSTVAYNCLKRMGVQTIGDVLDIYNRGLDTISLIQFPCSSKLVGEIKDKLIDKDYWSLLPDQLD